MKLTHFALAAGLLLAAGLTQAQTVHWYLINFPPYFILSGPEEGKGVFDQAMTMMIKGMPEFQHKVVEASLPRVIDSIKSGSDACSASLLKSAEREAVMDFSTAFSHLLPNGIVTLRKRAAMFKPYLNERGELQLEQMLSSRKFKLGLSADRSYGAAVDPLLKNNLTAIVNVPASDVFSSRLLKLMNQNEFDAIIGYAVELRHTVREHKLDAGAFVVYPIAESAGLLPVFVACSRSEQGKRIVAAIDRVLADGKLVRELSLIYRSRLDDETAAYYDQLVERLRSGK